MAQVSGGIGEAVAAVLVIDDDPQVRYLIRLALEEEGFDVATAGDGGPLIGIALLYGSRVTLDVVDGGGVTVEELP